MQMQTIDSLEERYTTWHNPLPVAQRVQIVTDDPRRPMTFTFPPGGERQISSRYDGAIQVVHSNGVIMGGLAPQLINKSLPEDQRPKLHHSLDTEKHARELAEAEAAAAEAFQRRAEDAAILAASRVEKQAQAHAAQAKKRAEIAGRGSSGNGNSGSNG